MREADIQKTILEYLSYRKDLFYTRVNAGDIYFQGRKFAGSVPGFPDILVLKDGRFIGLEVKTPKTYQNDNQKLVEAQILANGGCYHVVRSIEDVEKALTM